jgi:hypothetical protein
MAGERHRMRELVTLAPYPYDFLADFLTDTDTALCICQFRTDSVHLCLSVVWTEHICESLEIAYGDLLRRVRMQEASHSVRHFKLWSWFLQHHQQKSCPFWVRIHDYQELSGIRTMLKQTCSSALRVVIKNPKWESGVSDIHAEVKAEAVAVNVRLDLGKVFVVWVIDICEVEVVGLDHKRE